MPESKHTPGPWKVRDDGDYPYQVVGNDGWGIVADCAPNLRENDRAGNARLIAAAPKMLALFQDCQEAFEQEFQGEPRLMFLLNKIRALLARVEGK